MVVNKRGGVAGGVVRVNGTSDGVYTLSYCLAPRRLIRNHDVFCYH